MITLNMDNVKLTGKPDNYGALSNRLRCANAICAIDPDDLIDAVSQGISFTPAQIGGDPAEYRGKKDAQGKPIRCSDYWISQQVIAIDIDNQTEIEINGTKSKVQIDAPISPEDAIGILAYYDIKPFCVYSSFSDRADWRRFRIVLVLDEPITDIAQAQDLIDRCAGIFNHPIDSEGYFKIESNRQAADESIEPVKLFLGGKPDCIIDSSRAITSLEALDLLPKYRAVMPQIEPADNQRQTDANIKRRRLGGNLSALEAIYEHDKASFDLAGWIERNTAATLNNGYYDPCPICKHRGCLEVTGNLYHCFSANHPENKKGVKGGAGDIIDFLMQLDNCDYSAAIDRFKFDILGYDRNEWRQAWIDEQRAAAGISDEEMSKMIDDYNEQQAQEVQEVKDSKITSADMFDEFMEEIISDRFKPIPTGIYELDRALSGGFERKSLVTLAAAPGMGKTAIAQFLLENMAEQGHRVIYCNLEMDRSQLLSRSISRVSHKLKLNGRLKKDVTALDVRRGYKWNEETRQIVQASAEYYRKYIVNNFLYVTANPENSGSITNKLSAILNKLTAIAEGLRAAGQPAPLICIDYLQFIEYDQAGNQRIDLADQIKEILRAFKLFAMQYNTVVLMIMANNRTANKEGIASMESGRDTSNIEYSGDVMLGLTYTAVEDHETDRNNREYTPERINQIIDQAERLGQDIPPIAKQVSLKVVKNRGAAPRGSARFEFEGAYSYYRSIDFFEYQQAREQRAAQIADAKAQQEQADYAEQLALLQEAIASCATGNTASLQAVSDYMSISKREVMQIVQISGIASINNNKIYIPQAEQADADKHLQLDPYFDKTTPKAGRKPQLK